MLHRDYSPTMTRDKIDEDDAATSDGSASNAGSTDQSVVQLDQEVLANQDGLRRESQWNKFETIQ